MSDVIGGADLEIGVDATGAVADVEKSLQAIIKSGTKAGKEAAAAIEKGLSGPVKVEAAKAVEAATKNLAGAEDALARSIENRAIAAKGVEANERALAEIREQAGESSSKFAKAEQALMKSQQGLRQATEQVASAQNKALTASRTLTSAIKAAADAMDDGDDAAGGMGRALEGLRSGLSKAASSAASFAKDLSSKVVSGGKAALSKAGRLLGTSLTAGLKSTAKVAATAITGMLANSLTRGFARLKAIDDAKAKLAGLRYTGEQIDGVMQSALESVRGTAFGLGDAAGTAATLLAAGVEQGDALTRSLKVVADAATIAGADLSDMSLIFGKAAASNKVSGEVVQQLLERQIPVLGMLGKALGKTQGEVQKMVSAGEVSFETLQKAIEGSIGGAALASADSFSGGLANLNAAFGRFGAMLLDSSFQGLKGIFANAIPAVDALTDSVKPLVEELSNRLGPAITDLSEKGFKRLSEIDLSKATSSLSGLQGAAGPLIGLMLGALGGLLSGLPVVGGLFAGITGPIGLVLGLIVQMFTKSEALREAVSGVFESLTSAGGSLMPILTTVADLVGVFAKGLGDTLAEAINVVVPILSDLAEAILPVISDLFTTLAPVITDVVGALGDGLLTVISAVAPVLGDLALSLLPALSRILGIVAPLLEALAPLFQPLADLLVSVLVPALELLTPILTTLADLLATVVEWLGGAISGLIESFSSFGSDLDGNLVQPMSSAWGAIQTAVKPVVDWFKTYVAPLFEAVGGAISAVFSRLASHFKVVLAVFRVVGASLGAVWGTFWNVFKATWSSLGQPILAAINAAWKVLQTVATGAWNHIKTVIQTVLGVLTGIIKTATAVFKGDWKGALDAMKGVASSMWNGITGIFKNAISTIKGVLGTLKNTIINTFSNAGSWLRDAGGKIIGGFVDGIKRGFNRVKETLGSLTSMLPDWKGPAKRDATILKPAGQLLMQGLVAGITSSQDKVKKSLQNVTKSLTTIQEKAIKAEADRLIAARKAANDRIKAFNKTASRWRKKDLLPTLSRADAEKQAKANLKTASAAMKAAQKKVDAQGKTTARLWNRGTYQSSKVERWRGMNLGTTTLLNGLKANGAFTKTASTLVRSATLADIARAREDVAKSLAAAKDTLADMRTARADMAASVRDNIVGELDLTAGLAKDTVNEFGYTVKGKTTFASVAGTVKTLAAKAKTFATKLKELAKKGIPAGLIQEVAGYGTEQGIEVANALLSGTSQQVKDLSKDYASLTSWSASAGNTVAGSMYDVGIQAQQGLINGLNSDNKKLEAAAKKLSDRVVKSAKKALGIKSPSVVFRDEVGKMLGQGIDVGMSDYAPNLQSTVKSLMAPLKNEQIGNVAVPANGEQKGQYVTATEVLALLQAIRLDVHVGADQRTKAQWVLDGMNTASKTDGTTLSGILDRLMK